MLLALAAAGWYVVGIRQAHDVNRASAIVSGTGRLSAPQARRAAALLHSAEFINPDRQVDLLRAQLDRDQGDLRGARTILKRVVAAEPDNLQAWLLLARSSVGDRKDFTAAAHRIQLLFPPVPPAP